MPPNLWGQFPTVTQHKQRQYIRAYWRFLLGWGRQPPRFPSKVGVELRRLAKDEVMRYRLSIDTSKGATIYTIDNNYNDEPPEPPAKAA